MMYLGDFDLTKVIRFGWNSNAIAGESITRATNGTISVYKNGGITQTTTGVTDTEDFDSLTGVHLVEIDTGADGSFYSSGSEFMVVLSAATIDGKTINSVLAHFSLLNRSHLRPTTAGRTLDVSADGEAGLDWANVGSPTTVVGLSGTTVKTATDVETDTADIQSRLPAALVGGRIDANVGAISSDATAADNAEAFFDGTGYAGTNNVIPTVTTATNVTTVNGLAADVITASSIATSAVDEIVDAIWDEATSGHSTAGTTGKALTDAGSVGDPWATALPGAYGAGTAGKIVGDNINATVSSRASQTTLDTLDDFVDTEVAAIKAKTDNLPASPAAVGSAMTLAADAITAAVIATGAVDADAIAADAANEIADALLDRAAGVETGYTPRQALRLILSALAAKLSGAATTTVAIRDVGDTKDRITATVDANGNRTAVTLDAS